MAIWDLDSRGLYSLPSVNNYDQIIKQIIESSPSWERDGGGIRGRTIAPILSGISSGGGMAEFIPQQFIQNNNETIQRSAPDPIGDLILGDGAGGGDTPAHPWKITIRTVPDTDPQEYEYAIESGSRLFNGFGANEVTVVGADGEWRNLEEGYYLIEVDFEQGEFSYAQIQIAEEIGEFVEIAGDPPRQTKLKQQIGYIFFDDDGIPQLRQNAWHNYSLMDVCLSGFPAKVAIAT